MSLRDHEEWVIFGCTILLCSSIGLGWLLTHNKLDRMHKDMKDGSAISERQLGRIMRRAQLSLTTFQRWWNIHVLKIAPPDYPPPPPKGSNEDYYQNKVNGTGNPPGKDKLP